MKKIPNIFGLLQSFVPFATTSAAIVAITIAIRTETRNSMRFEMQLKQEIQIAQANVKPLLSVYSEVYLDKKSIILSNQGVGTAILKTVKLSRDSNDVTNIAKLFRFKSKVIWDDFRVFGAGTYVKAGEELILVLLTKKNLNIQGYTDDKAYMILREFENQSEKITIYIEYKDVLGNSQEPLNW